MKPGMIIQNTCAGLQGRCWLGSTQERRNFCRNVDGIVLTWRRGAFFFLCLGLVAVSKAAVGKWAPGGCPLLLVPCPSHVAKQAKTARSRHSMKSDLETLWSSGDISSMDFDLHLYALMG